MTQYSLTMPQSSAILNTKGAFIRRYVMAETGKGKRGPKGGRSRFQLVIPSEVLEEAKELADTENRSISNMLATLVTEAIRERKEKQWEPELMAA
jgi:hypothetical protein